MLAAFLLFMSNCDNAGNPADVTFEVTLPATLQIAAPTTAEITESVVLDATADPEIQKYLDKIKGYEITQMQFSIEDYDSSTGDEIYFSGNIGFSRIIDVKPFKTCLIQNMPVTHWAGTGYFDIDTCNDLFNEVSDLLLSDNGIKIYLTGTFSNAPLSFTLRVRIKVKVTANPL